MFTFTEQEKQNLLFCLNRRINDIRHQMRADQKELKPLLEKEKEELTALKEKLS